MRYCAVDVGAGGGFAWMDDSTVGKVMRTRKMPKTVKELQAVVASINAEVYFIEGVRLRHSDFEGHRAYAIVKMLANVVRLQTIIELAGKVCIEVYPMEWQMRLRAERRGLDYADRKRMFKAEAERIFTKTKVTLWNADALLIYEFVYRQVKGQSEWLRERCKKAKIKIFE